MKGTLKMFQEKDKEGYGEEAEKKRTEKVENNEMQYDKYYAYLLREGVKKPICYAPVRNVLRPPPVRQKPEF